ncbi:hypothetical protein ACFV94_32775 [Streptomyces sp. NPDC059896]|uniref:hypothetical protein n=1 Tax=Streptomyces sp. NPDC059896 TaxID=3346993 RepID=UPI00365E9739
MTGPLAPPVRRGLLGAAALAAVAVCVLAIGPILPGHATDTTLTGGTAREVVTLTVSPPRTGTATVDIRLTPRQRTTPTGPATVVTTQAVLPTRGHATAAVTAAPDGRGGYRVSGVHLMMPGRWELLIGIEGDGRRERLVFPLTVTG